MIRRLILLLLRVALVVLVLFVLFLLFWPIPRRETPPPSPGWEQNARDLMAPGARVLAIAAHPDDLEFYLGGTLARLAQVGAEVCAIVGTDGDKSHYYPAALAAWLGRRRREEQRAAGRILGYRNIVFLGYHDRKLAEAPRAVEQIAEEMRRLRPDIVLAFDSHRLWGIQHSDHRAAGEFALAAIRQAGISPEVYLFATQRPNTWVDVSETIQKKWQALGAHASQFGWPRLWLLRRRLLGPIGRQEGAKIGAAYAETLHRLPRSASGGQ